MVFSSYSKGLPSESETKKRQRLLEMKEYECGKRCLSPSIFRKSKGPIVLAASSSTFASTNTFESPLKSIQPSTPGYKKGDSTGQVKELTLQDYDINQCLDAKGAHCKTFMGDLLIDSSIL